MRKKSVAIVLANGVAGRGGIERIMLYVSRQIAVDCPDIPVVVQTSRWDLPHPLKHLSAIFGLAQFGWRLVTRRIAVAHINVAPRGSTFRKMLFAVLARIMGARVVLHLHGSGYDAFLGRLPKPIAAAVIRFFRRADTVIVLGSYWRDFALETLEIPPSRLIVIGNGVAAPSTLASPVHAVPVIAFMGLIGERKGVDILLDALEILKNRGISFDARLGGHGEIDRFASIAAAKQLNDKVRFLGWMNESDVSRILTEADIFVLPSRAENQPVAILEAMAHGLPVVATRIGAIPEQVADGTSGIIVPPEKADALADALERLCQDPRLRVAMGEAGRNRWQAHYSIEATTAQLADLYRKLMAEDDC